VSEKKAKPRWRQCRCAKAGYKQHGLTTRLPGKHTTPKETDEKYLLTSPNSESAPLSSLETYLGEYNLVVHAGPDITMHRVSLGMRVKELATICIGMIAIVAAPATWTIVTFIEHIILASRELQGTQSLKVEILPTKWGFGIVKVKVGLWSSNP